MCLPGDQSSQAKKCLTSYWFPKPIYVVQYNLVSLSCPHYGSFLCSRNITATLVGGTLKDAMLHTMKTVKPWKLKRKIETISINLPCLTRWWSLTHRLLALRHSWIKEKQEKSSHQRYKGKQTSRYIYFFGICKNTPKFSKITKT